MEDEEIEELKRAIFDIEENQRIAYEELAITNLFNSEEQALEFGRKVCEDYDHFLQSDEGVKHKIDNIDEASQVFSQHMEHQDEEMRDDYLLQSQMLTQFVDFHSTVTENQYIWPICWRILTYNGEWLLWEDEYWIELKIKNPNFNIESFVNALQIAKEKHVKEYHQPKDYNSRLTSENSQDFGYIRMRVDYSWNEELEFDLFTADCWECQSTLSIDF